MTYEEIIFLAQVLKRMGVEKIRFTGGEPLVRKGFFPFHEAFRASVPGIRTVLTTNGSLIPQFIDEIGRSGLSGVNVSLDTLDEDLFRFITRKGRLRDTIEGIRLLAERTTMPIKINTVIMKGVNDGEVEALLDFARSHRAVLRLIEFMPLDDSVWKKDLFIPASEILQRLPAPEMWERLDNSSDHSAGPARYFRHLSSGQKIGLIEAVSHHFCHKCNRLRVSATGIMRPCLFSEDGVFLRPALISGDAAEVEALILRVASIKPGSYGQARTGAMHMSQIGG